MHAGRRAESVRDGDVEPQERGRHPEAPAHAFFQRLIGEALALVVHRAGVDERAYADLADIERRGERQPELRSRGDERVADRGAGAEAAHVGEPAEHRLEVNRQWIARIVTLRTHDEDALT